MPGNNLKRRTFLQMCGVAAVGNTFYPPSRVFVNNFTVKNEPFKLSKPRWIIYDNGNYDLISNEIILKNCCPAINGQTVMPKNVFLGDSPKGRRIIYELSGGFLMLDLKTNRDSLSIGTEFSGFSKSPRWFYPISQAEVFGVKRFFRQGFGSGGPSGIHSVIPASQKQDGQLSEPLFWSYDSYMTFALMGSEETIAIGNIDHNDFLHRSAIYNRFHYRSLSHDETGDEHVFFEAAMLLNQTKIPNEYVKLPDLHFYTGNKPFETMEALAWRIGEKTKAREGSVTSYHLITNPNPAKPFSHEKIRNQIDYLTRLNPSLPIHTVSLSKGYCTVGDWLEPGENWPGGLDRVAREIFRHGYRAGIWTAPFIVAETSKLYQMHPDWLVKDFNDVPLPEQVEEEGSFYALDLSHPDVKKYLAKVFGTLRSMGYIFFETGYLESGIKDSFRVKRAIPGKSSVQIFREALQIIRDEIGVGSLWMAGQTAYAPVIGYADIVTLCNSCNFGWNENGIANMINEIYYSHYFNHILWQNNPGELDLSKNNLLTGDEKSSLALWAGMVGGAVGAYSNLKEWDSKYLTLFRFQEPARRPQKACFPFWPSSEEIKVAVRYYPQFYSWGLLFFNDKEESIRRRYLISDIIGEDAVFTFAWEPQRPMGFGFLSEITISLRPHQSVLFWVSKKNEPPPENLTIGGLFSEELDDTRREEMKK